MKILFIVAEFDEKKPVYMKTEAKKGGVFVIDDTALTEKKFYGKLLFQLENAISILKSGKSVAKKSSNTKKK